MKHKYMFGVIASCCMLAACNMDNINHYGEPCSGWAYVKTDNGRCSSAALSECNDEFRAAYQAGHCPEKYNRCTFDDKGDKFCMSGCASSDAPRLCNGKCVSEADYQAASIEMRDGVAFCTLAAAACPDDCNGCDTDGTCLDVPECPETCANGCDKDGACKAVHTDPGACPDGCPDGQKCVEGACVDGNPCTGLDCGIGLACIPVNAIGKCVDIACVEDNSIKSCEPGKICSKGACVYEACAVVSCAPGKICEADGSCHYETAPALVVSAIEKKETSESGDPLNLAVKLNHMPAADVTLACEIATASANPEASVDCAWVRFDADNWDSDMNIAVIGLADHTVDEDQPFALTITTVSEDPDFNGLTYSESLINKNVDKAEIVLSRTEIQTGEAGDKADFSVVLSSKPSADVKIGLSSSNIMYGTIENAVDNRLQLTFAAENWNVPQTVTVTGMEDGDIINETPHNYEIVFEKAVSEDPHYHELQAAPIKAVNLDNDKAEALISVIQKVACDDNEVPDCDPENDEHCEICMKEIEVDREYDENDRLVIRTDESGGSAMLKIRLGIAPTHDVEVLATIWDDLNATTDVEAQTEGDLSASELLIAKASAKEGVLLTIKGKEDKIIDSDQTYYIRLRFNSDDEAYHKLDAIWIKCINTNTDFAGFMKESDSSQVDEDSEINENKSPISYKISLASNPQSEVVATFKATDTTELKISPDHMIFSAENWNEPQVLTVHGKIDNIVDGNIKSQIAMQVIGDHYQAEDAIEVTTVDINTAGINLSGSGGSYREGSDESIDYDVWLNAKPEEDVIIRLVSSNSSALSVIGTPMLSFDSSNWDIHKKVSLKVGADVEENEYVRISMTSYSDEAAFNQLTAVSPEYVILDTSGANVSLSSAKTTLRPGDYATAMDVALSQDPAGPLTVTLTTSNDKTAAIEPKTLTFTSDDWNRPQTVKITVPTPSAAKSAKSIEYISAVTSDSGPYHHVKPKKPLELTIYQFNAQEFSYTGGSQNITLKPGKYKFEVWGGKGGDTMCYTTNSYYYGGKGGYSSGNIVVDTEKTFYVQVGGRGIGWDYTMNPSSGGYNGGGTVLRNANALYQRAGSGGGATHIATADGVLSSLKSNRSAVVIVAGGGGGSSANCQFGQTFWGQGYVGGGMSGGGACAGTQAEQSGNGAFGQGSNCTACPAGGGGYWGGGSYLSRGTGTAAGCGGSGYIGGVQGGVSTAGVQNGYGRARITIAE